MGLGGDRTIVEAVIDLGHKLDCEIVAEGVESEAQAALLRDMGCAIRFRVICWPTGQC